MNVVGVEKILTQIQPGALAPRIAQGGLGAFLHHVAQLAGQNELALARQQTAFNMQDLPAVRRPGQSQSHARRKGLFALLIHESGLSQQPGQGLAGHPERPALSFRHLARVLAADGADLPLQIAQTRLPRVTADDLGQDNIRDDQGVASFFLLKCRFFNAAPLVNCRTEFFKMRLMVTVQNRL